MTEHIVGLTADGWLDGNLMAAGEKVFSYFKPPISIQNPKEIWKGIRFRYLTDAQAYAETVIGAAKILSEIEQDVQNKAAK